jgi:hypothetical protein
MDDSIAISMDLRTSVVSGPQRDLLGATPPPLQRQNGVRRRKGTTTIS